MIAGMFPLVQLDSALSFLDGLKTSDHWHAGNSLLINSKLWRANLQAWQPLLHRKGFGCLRPGIRPESEKPPAAFISIHCPTLCVLPGHTRGNHQSGRSKMCHFCWQNPGNPWQSFCAGWWMLEIPVYTHGCIRAIRITFHFKWNCIELHYMTSRFASAAHLHSHWRLHCAYICITLHLH